MAFDLVERRVDREERRSGPPDVLADRLIVDVSAKHVREEPSGEIAPAGAYQGCDDEVLGSRQGNCPPSDQDFRSPVDANVAVLDRVEAIEIAPAVRTVGHRHARNCSLARGGPLAPSSGPASFSAA